MTPKQVQFSHHAVREMRKAQPPVTRQMVRSVLERGTRRLEAETPHGRYWFKGATIGGRSLDVLYLESARRIFVVTIYWTGRYD